jgi:hypothetical protein
MIALELIKNRQNFKCLKAYTEKFDSDCQQMQANN